MIATQKGVSGGKFALYVLGGAFIGGGIGGGAGIGGAALGSAMSIGGIIGGAVNGAISGAVTGASTGLAMGALAGLKGKEFGNAVGRGAGLGALTGLVGGAAMGGIQAGLEGRNILTGRGFGGEMGGAAKGTFINETIPPGVSPTAKGEIAVTETNPNYGQYGMTRSGGTTAHYGVDYSGEVGDPVFAMYDGKVTKVGYSSAYGPNHVRISSVINGTNYYVDYGHLSSASVVKGQQVSAGNLIGLMGREGNLAGTAFPTHVHIAVWRSVSIKGATMGFVQPSWIWRSHTIPWQLRLVY
jgi:hypothetical protein